MMSGYFKKTLLAGLLTCTPVAATGVVVHPSGDAGNPDKTYVYSALVQSSWDSLNELQGGVAKEVIPPNPLITALDQTKWDEKSVMPAKGWKTWQGPVSQELLTQAITEGKEMLPEGAPPPTFGLSGLPSGTLMVLGLQYTDIRFEKKFYRARSKPLEFKAHNGRKTKVQFFGTAGEKSSEYGGNVKVLAYRPSESLHALQVACNGSDDAVVLYRPAEHQPLDEAIRWVASWMKGYPELEDDRYGEGDKRLHREDDVRIPYLDLKFNEDASGKLQGSRYFGGPGDPWRIGAAKVLGRFELFEKGARLRVESAFSSDPFGAPPPPPKVVPRKFYYDAPFYVFLWRKGADRPYFAAWIGDASGMTKFEEE